MANQRTGRRQCSMNSLEQHLAAKLEERSLAGNLRQLTTARAAADLYSNDYLGLATTGRLAALMQEQTVDNNSTGSTGSRLLSGNSVAATELETTIATFHHAEAALLFNSGYDANMGLLASIANRHTTILYDELCHASIIDGIRLSQCNRKYRFAHNDAADLEQQLTKYKADGPLLVVVESVYSMDGDMAPLEAIVQLCEQHGALLVVDEAHATGVFGHGGAGVVCSIGLQDRVFARVHTFGKALGCHGAAVVGSKLLRDYLVNFARSFIYTTALPGHSLHAIASAYRYLASADFDNRPLHDLIAYFRQRIADTGSIGWVDSTSPIQVLVTGDNTISKQLAAQLQQAGLQVCPILHPTVPQGMERLRVCLHTFNTRAEVDRLLAVVAGN